MTRLTTSEKIATETKIAKVNARAIKRGFTGRFELVAERVEVEVNTPGALTPRFETYWDCEIVGEAPKYNGWTFSARVDRVGESFTLAASPGAVAPRRESVTTLGACDHCQSDRQRKVTYLIQHEDGRQMQVGSTCIKDFLGHDVHFVWVSDNDVQFDAPSGMRPEPEYRIEDALTAAVIATKEWGFVSANAYGVGIRTSERTFALMNPDLIFNDKERADVLAVLAAADLDAAKSEALDILRWIAADTSDSDYMENLRVLASEGLMTRRHLGLVASAPSSHSGHLGQIAERAAAPTSDWIGTIDTKMTVSGEVIGLRWVDGDYGSSRMVEVANEEGIVKMFTTAAWADTVEIGDHVWMVGATITKHEEYNGRKTTKVRASRKVTVTKPGSDA